MWIFKSLDKSVENHEKFALVVFKEKLKMTELTPEIETYHKLRVCVDPCKNVDKMAARIRQVEM